MKILALEFSSSQRSVAIVVGAGSPQPGSGKPAEPQTDGQQCWQTSVNHAARSAEAFALIEAALREAGIEREQVDCLAVGTGPGSYVGIRSAIGLAQGWQLAREVKLLSISSVDCLAAQAQAEGVYGRVAIVIDAQRGEFYLAEFVIGAADCHACEPLRLASRADVRQCQDHGMTLVGPELTNWFPDARVIYPSASTLGTLALKRSDFIPGEEMVPIYLRQTNFVKAPPPRILPA